MSKKLFITGVTGFIGGSIFDVIIQKHPHLSTTALIRSPNLEFSSRYPTTKMLLGTFDDFAIIERATSEADIIIHAGDIDHAGCVAAILSGLTRRTEQKKQTFLLHLTGTGCISDELTNDWTGSLCPRIWNDITDIKDIYNLPDEALHHVLDKQIMDANNEFVKTACVAPSDVYGQSKAVGNRTTHMVPLYVSTVLKSGELFYLGKGENMKAVVHVDDIAAFFEILLGHALVGGGDAYWGREGFYLILNEESVQWKQVAETIGTILVGNQYLPAEATKVVSWSSEQVANIVPHWPRLPRYLWGSSTRAVAARARKLGWQPAALGFWDSLEADVMIAAMSAKEKAAKEK